MFLYFCFANLTFQTVPKLNTCMVFDASQVILKNGMVSNKRLVCNRKTVQIGTMFLLMSFQHDRVNAPTASW